MSDEEKIGLGAGIGGLALIGGAAYAASLMGAASNPSSSYSGTSGTSGPFSEPSQGYSSRRGAYDAGLPCKNTSCKSFGIPHPNCRCYPGMAEGGEVNNFCSEPRLHHKDCQYFADGGGVEIHSDLIPSSIDGDDNEIPSEQFSDEMKEREENNTSPKKSTGERIGSALEGFAHTIGGSPAVALESAVGEFGKKAPMSGLQIFSRENQAKRKNENPEENTLGQIAGVVTGATTRTGAPGLAIKAGNAVGKVLTSPLPDKAAKVGANILSAGISSGLIAGDDEISKAILGQGNPADIAACRVAIAGAIGIIGGVVGETSGLLLSKGTDIGARSLAFIEGFGSGSKKLSPSKSKALAHLHSAFNAGVKAREKFSLPTAMTSFATAGFSIGENILDRFKNAAIGAAAAYGAGTASKYLGPALLKASLKEYPQMSAKAADSIIKYFQDVAKGQSRISKAVDGVFKSSLPALSYQEEMRMQNSKAIDRHREIVEEWVDRGGVNEELKTMQEDQNSGSIEKFAEGGNVDDSGNSFEHYFPDQNIAMNATKARISNYLGSLKPPKFDEKLPFDDAIDHSQKLKDYHRAIDMANQPLMILNEIKKGTIEPSDIAHFSALYPDLQSYLQGKITEKITKDQLAGKKPSYAVRQGLSMFLGTPLSSDLKPQNIMAAQNVFAAKKAQQQAQAASPKSKPGSLSKAPMQFLTGEESRIKREQKQ